MSCDEFKHLLHGHFGQTLPAAQSAAVEAHARECRDCGALMQLARELSCKEFVETLNEYVDGELEPTRKEVFERHLGICRDCTAYLDSYRKTMQLSVAAMLSRPVPEPGPPLELLRAIIAARKR